MEGDEMLRAYLEDRRLPYVLAANKADKLGRSEQAQRLDTSMGAIESRRAFVEELHRGIAARQFQRTFVLADGMDVQKADLKNGLLSIDLARPEPARVVRTIQIAEQE